MVTKKKSKKETPTQARPKMVRKQRITVTLNEVEARVIDRFCTKYKIQNRTKFFRETIIRAILKKQEEDAPTLFDDF